MNRVAEVKTQHKANMKDWEKYTELNNKLCRLIIEDVNDKVIADLKIAIHWVQQP